MLIITYADATAVSNSLFLNPDSSFLVSAIALPGFKPCKNGEKR